MMRDEWSLVVEALGLREMLDGMDARHMIGGCAPRMRGDDPTGEISSQ